MKFAELKKSLKEKILNNYLLLGNDTFLLQKSFSLIKESINFEPEELNVNIFSDNINIEEVVKALNTMPVLCEYKLVYVNFGVKTENLQNLKSLTEYLKSPNPSSILVINAGNNKADVEKLIPLMEVVDCNKLTSELVKKFVLSELNQYAKTIEVSALNKLCEYSLYDLGLINAEISKLIGYVGQATNIGIADVELIVTKNLDYQVFDLTEHLAKKNSDKVFEILADMKTKKENEKNLFPLIYNHFRRLLHVSLNSASSNQEISKLLKVKEYAITVASRQSKLFSQKILKKINDLCLQLDFDVKSGEMNYDNALNYLILQILNY